MPVTASELDIAQELIAKLLGDSDEAAAYAEDPEGYLAANGYGDVSPEAIATCGVGGPGGSGGGGGAAGGGAGASGYAYAAPPPPGAGAVAQLDSIVYNHYYNDSSITNNLVNHGNIQVGDGNVAIGDVGGDFSGQVQTGDGVQAGGDINQAGGDLTQTISLAEAPPEDPVDPGGGDPWVEGPSLAPPEDPGGGDPWVDVAPPEDPGGGDFFYPGHTAVHEEPDDPFFPIDSVDG